MSELTFKHLKDAINNNYFASNIDKEIAIKLVEAERDWRTTIDTVADFIKILEQAIATEITENSLNQLMQIYLKDMQGLDRYAWEMESISYLLDIFTLTNEPKLHTICIRLGKKLMQECSYSAITDDSD